MIRQSVSDLAKRSGAPANNLKRDLWTNEDVRPTKSRIRFCGSRATGKHAPARIGRRKNCRLTNKSPRAIGRGDFRTLWSEPTGYFKTIAVNG
jgi:hypothetical protein